MVFEMLLITQRFVKIEELILIQVKSEAKQRLHCHEIKYKLTWHELFQVSN